IFVVARVSELEEQRDVASLHSAPVILAKLDDASVQLGFLHVGVGEVVRGASGGAEPEEQGGSKRQQTGGTKLHGPGQRLLTPWGPRRFPRTVEKEPEVRKRLRPNRPGGTG